MAPVGLPQLMMTFIPQFAIPNPKFIIGRTHVSLA